MFQTEKTSSILFEGAKKAFNNRLPEINEVEEMEECSADVESLKNQLL